MSHRTEVCRLRTANQIATIFLVACALVLPYAVHAQTTPFYHTLKTALANRTTSTDTGALVHATATPPAQGTTEQVDVTRVSADAQTSSAYNAGHDSISSTLAAVGAVLALVAVILIVVFAFVVPRKNRS
ncbi:MAG: hypothetical protein WC477_01905 [Patescibacteria group bacterium]